MNMLYKILVLVLLSAVGFTLVPIMIHFTIWAEIINSETVPQGFLEQLIQNSIFVWVGAAVVGIISLFIEKSWRIALLLCPLILPSLFALIYTITQS